MNGSEIDQLQELAQLYGLATSFHDGLGNARRSSNESVVAVLRSMGAPLFSIRDVPVALRERKQQQASVLLPPVTVAWQDEIEGLVLKIQTEAVTNARLTLETGEQQDLILEPLQCQHSDRQGSGKSCEKLFTLPADLRPGYHRLEIETKYQDASTLLIVSPNSAFVCPENEHRWGVFLPLYSLSSCRNWGAGDFTDLERLVKWVASLGGHFLGMLPLFAAFLQHPLDPSPYAPVSRLFWNEFFVDPTLTAEWTTCREVQEIYNSTSFQKELAGYRSSGLLDYGGQMKLKRRILERLAQEFHLRGGANDPAFRKFLADGSEVADYAAFRAVQERQVQPWGTWPERMRRGVLREEDYSPENRDYHLYAQWQANQQMGRIQQLSTDEGVGLYLDLPLGVHPDGYDVWRDQALFAPEVAGGAPPDAFFKKGQDWGFRPLHPEHSQLQGHSYFREIVRHLMRHSNLLRIDHVMSMHRLYWIPSGHDATDGVYAHYPWEELYAILTLESHRERCVIVGEDLGTVPPSVRESMADHRIHRMYVSIFETSTSGSPPLNVVPRDTLASLNTHDTATFSAFWQGLDIEDRRRMGLLDDQAYDQETSERAAVTRSLLEWFSVDGDPDSPETRLAVLKELLNHLGSSDGRYVLVNLEDLWLETTSQNVPGTETEKPNWRGKTRFSFEQFSVSPELLSILREMEYTRKRIRDHGEQKG